MLTGKGVLTESKGFPLKTTSRSISASVRTQKKLSPGVGIFKVSGYGTALSMAGLVQPVSKSVAYGHTCVSRSCAVRSGTDCAYAPAKATGRRPFPVEAMLHIHVMRQWFGLSDVAMEEALYDTPLYREFAGL